MRKWRFGVKPFMCSEAVMASRCLSSLLNYLEANINYILSFPFQAVLLLPGALGSAATDWTAQVDLGLVSSVRIARI